MTVTNHHEPGRKPGRPKKGELVVRKMTNYRFDSMKPERRTMCAKSNIQAARALYARYSQPYPNPLNIDDKDLTPEAKACWEYMFSQRGYTEQTAFQQGCEEKRRLRTIEGSYEVVYAFECYLNWIRKNNFVRGFTRPDGEQGVMPIIPNQTNFARWLGLGRHYIYTVMYEGTQEDRDQYRQLLADCLSEGAMVGAYNTASTIFTLKNMCDWADKYEDRSVNKADDLGVAEAEELMKQLGYAREKASLPTPMAEGDTDG